MGSLLLGAVIVLSGVNLVRLAISVNVMNALLLPVVLGFLYLLARKALPEPWRLCGGYAATVAVCFAGISGVCLYAAIAGML